MREQSLVFMSSHVKSYDQKVSQKNGLVVQIQHMGLD